MYSPERGMATQMIRLVRPQAETRSLPIIVGGFLRSGTSLLRRLLDGHSRIHCGPEVKFFRDFYGDYLDDPLRHVRLFGTLLSLGLTLEDLLPMFGRTFVECHQMAAAKAGKARWADKNPENVLYLGQWEQLLPNGFLFVHVVRHPLDTLASLQEIGFPKAVPPEFVEKVILYRRYREAGTSFSDKNPERSYTVHYESLVTDPSRVLAKLMTWAGEHYEPAMIGEFLSPLRGTGIEDPKIHRSKTIHCKSIGRWKKDLSQEEIFIARNNLPEQWTKMAPDDLP